MNTASLILYTGTETPRLHYIVDFMGKTIPVKEFTITSSKDAFIQHTGPKINYSDQRLSSNEIWIKPHSLLFETGIRDQVTMVEEKNGRKIFFKTEGDWSFDLFAAAFFLISRYEEYLPHARDMYGRYAFENSLAWRENFLNVPLVNEWLNDFVFALQKQNPGEKFSSPIFTFLPTYDIDIAWSYKHKGWWRNAGGFLRSFFRGEWGEVKKRFLVLSNKQKDPFDSFGWLNSLHECHKLKPYYFFLVPEKRGKFDKNISPKVPAMQALIRDHVIRYPIGIHPSWKSGDDVSLLKEEIATLSRINGSEIVSSRQHYIRFELPTGYRRLIEQGIRFDFSMGYGSINGFRASVASPFYWYDLESEKQTDLMVFPFCYMEANSFYEQKQSTTQALDEMRDYYQKVKSTGGYFIMIWHNSFLGTDRLYSGWKDIYEQFITETQQDGKAVQ